MREETRNSFTRIGLLAFLLTGLLVYGYYNLSEKSARVSNQRLFTRANRRLLAENENTPVENLPEGHPTQGGSHGDEGHKHEGDETEADDKAEKGHGEGGEHKGGGEHESSEALVTYAIVVMLILGGFCREIKKLTNMPYTPQLLVVGIVMGACSHMIGDLGKAFYIILQINPHGILMIFIPTIIFESAYNSDPFTTKKQLGQILLLAGPGVVVGAMLITLGFNYLLGYSNELSIAGGLTFGSIVCATDPVAVVALLKELGTPLRFNMLLEGESLLNDGTAMVFYLVFSSIYKEQEGVTFFTAILKFLQLSVGGVLLGAVACFVTLQWLRKIVKDEILTISITFFSCYLTFYIGEAWLGVSGILAIVSLGVLMSMYGKVRINPESEHSVHIVWSFIQYVLETVIFIMTGGYIGYYTIYLGESTIGTSDWIRMVLFYFVMTFARFIMIYLFKPLLSKTGYPVTNKDIVVLTYGGLRGAIALCLGLIVYTDEEYDPRFRDLVLFYLTGMITLTVLLNGLTMKMVMAYIDFIPRNKLREKLKEGLSKSLVINSVKHQVEFSHNKYLALANWNDAYEYAGVNQIIKDQRSKAANGEIELREGGQETGYSAEENLAEIRYRVYRLIKQQCWEKFEESFCGSSVATVLKESVDQCMDNLEDNIWIYECVSNTTASIETLQWLLSYRNTIFLGRISMSFINTYLLQTYETLSTLIVSLEQIIDNKPLIPLSQNYVNQIFSEVVDNKNKAEQQLFLICDTFPEMISYIQSKQAAHMLLNAQKEHLNHESHLGTINDDEFTTLVDSVNKRINLLENSDKQHEVTAINDFTILAPLFNKLEKEDMEELSQAQIKNTFKAGSVIYTKGQPTTGVYIIVKGIVEDQISNEDKDRYGLGSVIHWANVILTDITAKSTVTAITDTVMYFIGRPVLEKVISKNPDFEESITKATLGYLLKVYPPMSSGFSSSYGQFEDSAIMQIIKNSKVVRKSNGEALTLDFGGFLVSGEMKLMDDSMAGMTILNTPTFIMPTGDKNFKVVKTVKVLKFNESLLQDDNEKGSIRKSIMGATLGVPGGGSIGHRKPSMGVGRNSVMVMINKEKDIDKLFEDLVRSKFSNL